MEGEDSILVSSPSFSSYSSSLFAETAAKVSKEFQDQREELGLEEESTTETVAVAEEEEEQVEVEVEEKIKTQEEEMNNHSHSDEEEDDDDFEFAVLSRDPNGSPISADEIFANGQIKPIYPVFNRDLLFAGGEDDYTKLQNGQTIKLPLRKLMIQEREPSSSSSSESDEFEALPDGTYCVWTPKPAQSSPERCKKSNSTGSCSRRWRLRNLLHRSNSDGKDTFVFLTKKQHDEKKKDETKPEASSQKKMIKEKRISGDTKDAGKAKFKEKSGEGASASAHEVHYVRNRAMKEGDRRRSYLPYRQDLVGLFANVNGLNRTLHPF